MGLYTMNQQNIQEDIELSIVIPCYNEEEVLPVSMPPLLGLFQKLSLKYEVILVNYGSWDTTPKVIDSFTSQGYPVKRVDVPVNQGYGWGIICGLKEARGKYIGYMCCDGQISPEDVIRTFQAIQGTQRGVLTKIKRYSRADGWVRDFSSKSFNLLFRIMFGAITSDVNGVPKFFHREDLRLLNITSKDSFIDPELMIKAKALNFSLIEVPVPFYQRQGGTSKIKVLSISFQFLKNMMKFRFGKGIKNWLAEEQLRPDKFQKAYRGNDDI